ncbi:hypothetical protein E2P64_06470 [Candidatus Bathyarchaeota archaeon]|nr:hypothetical protein E2P64_06470 [Candidatus Bathyarchaeota archaeon]
MTIKELHDLMKKYEGLLSKRTELAFILHRLGTSDAVPVTTKIKRADLQGELDEVNLQIEKMGNIKILV